MIRRLSVMFAIAALAAACASTPQSDADRAIDPREKDPKFRYGNNPGPSPVGVIPDVMLNDAARSRDVRISIEYPTRSGSNPLVVVSHASGGSNRAYPGLTSHWASFGYVVVRVSHADNDTNIDAMTTALWRDRARDVSLVLDNLTQLAERYPELAGKIDANRIAVAGHGRGAMTALMLGGLRTFPGANTYADPRVKAVVAMSPAGPNDAWGFTNDSFAEIRIPALYLTGTRDAGATETETPEWRARAFELSPAGDKWLVIVEDLASQTFTGVAGPAPVINSNPLPRQGTQITGQDPSEVERQRIAAARQSGHSQRVMFGRARAVALAFFDLYLKDDAAARTYLTERDARANIEVKSK